MFSFSAANSARVSPPCERVRIESGPADHRDHVAICRIDRDDGRAPVCHGFFRDTLRFIVDAQHQVLARDRRDAAQLRGDLAQLLDRSPPCVDQNLAGTIAAVQRLLERGLDTELAYRGGAGIFGSIDLQQICF